MEYETVIGLEVHVELSTKTKIFCGCSTAFGGEPNAHTCPVCLGMPGSLPVLNRRVVEKAIRAGLALNCDIQADNRFDRKNYFYPDLPKDYQISQLYRPICRDGFIAIDAGGRERRVGIHEIHMEEDAGKLLHDAGASLVDYNRCGVPLIEIVSEPDLRSAEEVMAYLEKLREILVYTDVSDCKMQEGSMRADVNLSVRPVGASEYGTRTETKNMNSFKAIQRAIEYERKRQIAVLTGGGRVIQETRRWDDEKGENYAMRSKENAQDYRYFPDPDLLPVHVSEAWIEAARAELPELAEQKRARYAREFGIEARVAGVLTASRRIALLFEETAAASGDAREAANLVAGDILRLVKETGADPDEVAADGKKLGAVIRLVKAGKINRGVAKTVAEEVFKRDVDPEEYVRERGLSIIEDKSLLDRAVASVLAENPQSVADYRAGKEKAFGFLVGQVMRLLKGQADPKAVNAALREALDPVAAVVISPEKTEAARNAAPAATAESREQAPATKFPQARPAGEEDAQTLAAARNIADGVRVRHGASDPLGEARALAEESREKEASAEAPPSARLQTTLASLKRRWDAEDANPTLGKSIGKCFHTGQPEVETPETPETRALPGLPNRYRTKTCADLRPADVGREERLAGWVQTIRNHGGVAFIDLRDHYGVTQTVVTDEQLRGLHRESVLSVRGCVLLRDPETVNPNLATGLVELKAEEIELLGQSPQSLPFEVDASTDTREELRLRYRFLDLRNPKVHDNILLRAEIIRFLRREMEDMGFVEIQTPILANSSPEGARDYLVPSRKHKGKFYALPQAPQQFKQLLMVSGFDRYFQIAPCFRDEDARLDRSPGEFYQLDFEMAFATQEDVFAVAERVLVATFKRFSDKVVSKAPFARIPFKEAMLRYGTDKPDLRNPLFIIDLSDFFASVDFAPFKGRTVRGIVAPGAAAKPRSFFSSMEKFALSVGMKGLGYVAVQEDLRYKGPIDKFFTDAQRAEIARLAALKPHDVLYFISDEPELAAKYAGRIRTELAERLGLIADDRCEFCFITDFPMYEINEESGRIDFTHNPFSMPQGEMDALLSKDPLEIMAWQYDIVCNGVELSSGAVRNHRPDVMVKAFEIAGYSEKDVKEKFGALYNAFRYGAPPHAGMAPGVDRIVMLLTGETNIREVIPFPLDSNARNLLLDAPSEVTEAQLREAHIKLR